jgi:hypothetical protein
MTELHLRLPASIQLTPEGLTAAVRKYQKFGLKTGGNCVLVALGTSG